MYAATNVPGPVYGLAGAAMAAAAAVWQARRAERADARKASGTVETSDATTIFTAAMTNFEQSEKLRHDLAEQVGRCQNEIGKLKDERDALEQQLKEQQAANEAKLVRYRQRVESLEDELFDMGQRLKREFQPLPPRPPEVHDDPDA